MSYRPRQWRTIDRRKGVFRKKFRPVMMKSFEQHMKPFYEKIMQITPINNIEIDVMDLDQDPVRKFYEHLYRSAAMEFGKFDRIQAKQRAGVEILKDEDEIAEDLIMAEIDAFMSMHLGGKITAIGNTTKVLIQRKLDKIIPEIIEQGYGAGTAQTMLRDRIQSEWHQIRYFRTERIVRTEVGTATNFGSISGVRTTSVPHVKHWVSAMDQETRVAPFNHMISETADLDRPFFETGEEMDFPLDPSGSAGNVINCRCCVTYSLKE